MADVPEERLMNDELLGLLGRGAGADAELSNPGTADVPEDQLVNDELLGLLGRGAGAGAELSNHSPAPEE